VPLPHRRWHPTARVRFSQRQRIIESLQEGGRLGTDGVSGEGKPVLVIVDRIGQTPDRVNQGRLTRLHGKHLTDPTRFERAGHEEQVAILVQQVRQRQREPANETEVRVPRREPLTRLLQGLVAGARQYQLAATGQPLE